MSEWLRRWTRNPLGSARKGSNPFGVVLCMQYNSEGTACIVHIQGTAASVAHSRSIAALLYLAAIAIHMGCEGMAPRQDGPRGHERVKLFLDIGCRRVVD